MQRKNTFEWSRTTGGRKEGAEEGRWHCLAFPFLVNRGFGNKTSSWRASASAYPLMKATHQSHSSQYAILFSFRVHLSCPLSLLVLPLFIFPPHASSARHLASFPCFRLTLSGSPPLISYPRLCVNIHIKVPICVGHLFCKLTTVPPCHVNQQRVLT
jgi:hypothetical protein